MLQVSLSAPLFLLALLGYALVRWFGWATSISAALTKFIFSLALPAMLFCMMMDFFSKKNTVDARLLLAFFGSCLIVFVIGRAIAAKVFKMDGVSGSVFALGGIFSNNGFLGIPIAKALLGPDSLPSIALVIAFNSLILWTLVTASVEFARSGTLSVKGFAGAVKSVLKNPLIIGVFSGTILGLLHAPLPSMLISPLRQIGDTTPALSLVALGMSLAEYRIRDQWQQSVAITCVKLLVQPFVVWMLAISLGLPKMETQAVVLLGSMAIGANVYLMARQFNALEGPVASSLVLSTAMAAITTPLILTIIGVQPV